MATENEKIVNLAPDVIQAEDNARYSILKSDVEALMSSITAHGSIHTPIEVEPLNPAVNGFKYRLTVGFRRYLAAVELNKTGAGMTLPSLVRTIADPTQRLTRQLSENIDRKSLSPMDQAVAIKKLLDAGVSRAQVKEMFKRPGGRKGNAVQPASNSFVNMTLSFLDLSKDIREKIHDGRVGVATAYELTKVSPERRAEVLAAAEKSREAALAKEEKDEAKYLEAESKLGEVKKQEEETVTSLDHAKAELELAQKAHDEKLEEAQKAHASEQKIKDKDAKKVAHEAFKAIESDAKGLEKLAAEAANAVRKLEQTQSRVATQAAELKAKLEESRKVKPGAKTKKAVGPGDVKTAAKEVGASSGAVAMKLADIRKLFLEISTQKMYPIVGQIGTIFAEAIAGVLTPGQVLKKLAAITGETKAAKK